MDVYLAEFDLFRREAESELQMGGAPPRHVYRPLACSMWPYRDQKSHWCWCAYRATWAPRQSRVNRSDFLVLAGELPDRM